jgi:hypothetical protein
VSGPAVCSDKVGDSVGARETSRAKAMQIGANGGGESSSDVNMWSRRVERAPAAWFGPSDSPVGLGGGEPQSLSHLWLWPRLLWSTLVLEISHYFERYILCRNTVVQNQSSKQLEAQKIGALSITKEQTSKYYKCSSVPALTAVVRIYTTSPHVWKLVPASRAEIALMENIYHPCSRIFLSSQLPPTIASEHTSHSRMCPDAYHISSASDSSP